MQVAKKTVHLWVGAVAIAGVLSVGSAVAAISPPSKKGGAGAGAGPAIAIPLSADLSAAQVPSLQVASTASGRFLGALTRAGFSGQRGDRPNLSWGLFWAIGVRNTTGPITSVEIRSGGVSAAAAGPVVFKLCGPCNSASAAAAGVNDTTLVSGTPLRNLTAEQVATLRRAELFVNVTTAANPAGELRGPITRRSPVTSGAPPNTRQPNPLKPGAPGNPPGPPIKLPVKLGQ